MKKWFILHPFLCCLLLFVFTASSGQSYGLAFASNEVVQDKRTGIDLSPGSMLRFTHNFELEFEISIVPNKVEYFGYIVRIISDSKRNIDLIYDNTPKHFKVITGERLPEISFNVQAPPGVDQWHTIKMQFDAVNKQLTVLAGEQRFTQKVELDANGSYKILFGENRYGNFQTTDVPPISVRNIRVNEAGRLRYEWPLDEDEGTVARETVRNAAASVSNPRWIRKLHRDWQALKNFTLPGPVSTAFDSKRGIVYLVGYDSLLAYDITNGITRSIAYASGKQDLLRGNQSIFETQTNSIHNLYPDQSVVSAFDSAKRTWNKNFISPAEITDNWHFNKFFSPEDSSIYLLSGYGHFIYKNGVKKYNIFSQTWDSVIVTGDFFTPRYLAGLGVAKDGAYIMGGFGSQSGQQILSPKNLYDLIYFDRNKKTFKKIYQLDLKAEDFVFGNSLVIDEKERVYYGLVYPNQKYDASLQLVKGSLDTPSVEHFASSIPYRFHDIHSFADLYFSETVGSFVAVTLFWNDNNQTEVGIHSLSFPPLKSVVAKEQPSAPWIGYGVATVVALGVIFLFLRKRRRVFRSGRVAEIQKVSLSETQKPHAEEWQKANSAASQEITSAERQNLEPLEWQDSSQSANSPEQSLPNKPAVGSPLPDEYKIPESLPIKNTIHLFGDLQLFDAEGHDITRSLTPLLKELFLIILIYTVRKERGISSEKLKEILWFDKTAESARNNRSVNIAKLKSILDRLQHVEVSKETAYWKINFDHNKVHVDYFDSLAIINEKGKLDKDKIQHLANITRKGSFLTNLEYDWLEPFKSEMSNLVIDTYLHYAATIRVSEDPEFLIQIANYIFDFDTVNEDAMVMKCKSLAFLGKHSLAKHTFENFNREYKILYGEEFSKAFQHILDH